ncbi:MAG: hypothetical protein IPO49_09795 [Bacteroidetes bacterium]|nr:hypothetical protein [Bacteroidota bacterium]
MNNTLISTDDKEMNFQSEFNNAVNYLFEEWKKDYLLEINNCPDKDEYLDERMIFFKNIIFNKTVDSVMGFPWLNTIELDRSRFYSHLRLIRTNKYFRYEFMNRTINGKRLNAFDGDIIPEVYAGAAWKFYCWLNEINSKTYIRSDTTTVQLSLIELAYVCYFNNENVTPETHYEIAKKYGVKPSIKLYQEYKKFVKDGLGSGISSKQKDKNKIKRYEKIISEITNESGFEKAKLVLDELKTNHAKALCDGLYSED